MEVSPSPDKPGSRQPSPRPLDSAGAPHGSPQRSPGKKSLNKKLDEQPPPPPPPEPIDAAVTDFVSFSALLSPPTSTAVSPWYRTLPCWRSWRRRTPS